MTPTNVDGLEAASFTISPSWSSSNFFPYHDRLFLYGAGSISIPNFSLNSAPAMALSVTINPTNIAWLPAATTSISSRRGMNLTFFRLV